MDVQLPTVVRRGQLGNDVPNSPVAGTGEGRLNLTGSGGPVVEPNRRTAFSTLRVMAP